MLRDAYSQDRKYFKQCRQKITELTGFTYWQVRAQAKRMGLRIFSSDRRRWTEKENQYLLESAGTMPVARLAEILGRSENGVAVHMRRIGLRTRLVREGLTKREFAEIMGVPESTVQGWLGTGKLRTYEGRITDRAAKEFVSRNHELYSIRRVDDFMFKALIFGQ